jgi:hypothetical protein
MRTLPGLLGKVRCGLFKDVALLSHPLEFSLQAPQFFGLGQLLLPLTRGQLLLLHPLVQAVGADTKPGRYLGNRVTPLKDLTDRFNLEFFWKSLLIHGTSYWASGLRLEGVYKFRVDSQQQRHEPEKPA